MLALEAEVAALRAERDALRDWLGQVANCSGMEDTPESQADVDALCALVAEAHEIRRAALAQPEEGK